MDWNIPVCVWVIEMDREDPKKDEAVRQLLYSHGYKKASWDINAECQFLQASNPVDCQPNEVFEHPLLKADGSCNS